MIYPSLRYDTTGRTGHIHITVYNPADDSVLVARTTTGIVELASGTAFYLVEGGYNYPFALVEWDDDGTFLGGEILNSPAVVGAAVTTQNGVTGPGTVFVIKRNDSAPSIQYQCRKADNTPVDVSGSAVQFKMRLVPDQGSLIVNRPAVIIDGPNGVVQYNWQHSGLDTATANEYDAEFQVTFPDGSVETFPTTDPDADAIHEYLTVKIPKDLD